MDYQDYPTNGVGRGHNMAAFLRGKDASNADKDYMMLVWSRDSGKGEGGISFWNWDTPATWSAPTKKKHLVASQLREAHSTPVTNMFAPDWRTWVLQATPGFSVYSLASVATPLLVTSYAISGASKGGAGSAATCSGGCFGSFNATNLDYSGGAVWFLALAAPYLYVAQADNGLNIYKFTNQGNAASITWLKRYDTSWFGHRVNQIWVRGNFAVAAAVQSNYGVTLLDLSNPESPVALKKYGLTTNPKIRNAYTWTLNGNWLYAATKQQGSGSTALLAGLTRYAIATDPVTQYKLTTQQKVDGGCSTGGYAAIQDNFAHIGLSTCVQKIDLDKIGTGQEPRQAPFPLPPPSPPPAYWKIDVVGADNDFETPLGNTVFIGSDHHPTPGSVILCHAAAADIRAPVVNGRNPASGATGVKVTAGVGLSFSDNLKPWTINSTSLPIRVQGSSTPVAGYYSYQLNTVNFRPAADFAKNTVYEVAVTSSVKDLAGNGATASVATFQTGN